MNKATNKRKKKIKKKIKNSFNNFVATCTSFLFNKTQLVKRQKLSNKSTLDSDGVDILRNGFMIPLIRLLVSFEIKMEIL